MHYYKVILEQTFNSYPEILSDILRIHNILDFETTTDIASIKSWLELNRAVTQLLSKSYIDNIDKIVFTEQNTTTDQKIRETHTKDNDRRNRPQQRDRINESNKDRRNEKTDNRNVRNDEIAKALNDNKFVLSSIGRTTIGLLTTIPYIALTGYSTVVLLEEFKNHEPGLKTLLTPLSFIALTVTATALSLSYDELNIAGLKVDEKQVEQIKRKAQQISQKIKTTTNEVYNNFIDLYYAIYDPSFVVESADRSNAWKTIGKILGIGIGAVGVGAGAFLLYKFGGNIINFIKEVSGGVYTVAVERAGGFIVGALLAPAFIRAVEQIYKKASAEKNGFMLMTIASLTVIYLALLAYTYGFFVYYAMQVPVIGQVFGLILLTISIPFVYRFTFTTGKNLFQVLKHNKNAFTEQTANTMIMVYKVALRKNGMRAIREVLQTVIKPFYGRPV